MGRGGERSSYGGGGRGGDSEGRDSNGKIHPALLTSHIKGCRTPEQLGDLIETHDFDYIHVVVALGSLTRMQQGPSSLTLTKLTALVRTNMGRMKARELANTLPYRMRPTRNVVLMLVGCGADAIAFEK